MAFYRLGYHKEFDGYAERKITDGEKSRIERVYVGAYFQADISDRSRIIRKILYPVLIACAAAIWAVISLSGMKSLTEKYSAFFPALTIFPVFFAVRAVFHYCIGHKKLKVNEYRLACKHLKLATLLLSLFLLASAITEVVFTAKTAAFSNEWPGIAGFLAAAALALIVCITEFKTTYMTVPNEVNQNGEYDDAVEITW